MTNTGKPLASLMIAALATAWAPLAVSQSGTSVNEGDWPNIHGSASADRYSPLDQINADNVGELEIAWQFSTANFGPATDFVNPSTPIEIDGVLYLNLGTTRNVVALDATNGQV
jgi:quinoprotein glucose dehydrogenase